MIVLFLTASTQAQLAPLTSRSSPPPTATARYSVVERGPHHRVMANVTWTTNSMGRIMARTSSYTELATGMNCLKDGKVDVLVNAMKLKLQLHSWTWRFWPIMWSR